MKDFIAHIDDSDKKFQTIEEHCKSTARLCYEYAITDLKSFMYAIGLMHDIGKYQDSFQKRIRGSNIKVEHSTCGAKGVEEIYPNLYPMGLMMAYCVAGHHSGIPDGGVLSDSSDMTTLCGRLKRNFENYDYYKKELYFPEINFSHWVEFMMRDCDHDVTQLIDKFAFFTRYAFSCLVDADSIDTANFSGNENQKKKLKVDFVKCLHKVDAKLSSFVCKTRLQQTRSYLQNQAFENAKKDAGIYLLNMPTGSGKTFASIKIALERVISKEKERIIYVIPYNSIIDQTVTAFENLFQEDAEILQHHSTFAYDDENKSEDYRNASKIASENWGAPFIITTSVQFFESLYSNKRGKLRKLHHMANSVLVFDEAHLMPTNYLQPCLQAISYITQYLNSEAIFLTATMPDFSKLIREYALPSCKIENLLKDTSLFKEFRKCKFQYLGEVNDIEILDKVSCYPSALIVVNNKDSARRLFNKGSGRKYHLSTYMTSYDRKKVLEQIRKELYQLEKDFPDYIDVPNDRKITVISTSLIEAGVDLDCYTVFRETAGLDNILQAGGRCNREGKRKSADVFVFDFANSSRKVSKDIKGNLTKGLLKKYTDISCPECIKEYYNRLYFINREDIEQHAMHKVCNDIRSIPFKDYSEKFELIESRTLSLVVERDDRSRAMIEALKYAKTGNARKLQNYVCSIYQKELDDLISQHVVDDFGTGIFCLINSDYYDENTGILFEPKDYYIGD